ncbi:MAG: hypothetical protein ACHQJ6_01530 [Candidatus Berkiellales bacterium]
MKNLSKNHLTEVTGGKFDEGTPYISSCSTAVINFLKYRGDMLSAVIEQNLSAKNIASDKMNHYQKIASVECSTVFDWLFQDVRI